jgi:hypothetical protein
MWNADGYRLETVDTSIITRATSTRIIGLQISISPTEEWRYGIFSIDVEGVVISDNIIKQANDYTQTSGVRANKALISNNIIYGFTGGGIVSYSLGGVNYIYHNTISSNNSGIQGDTIVSFIVKNNVVFNNADDFNGTFALLDHNASDDGDGTNAISLGSSTAIWKATFTDYENGDFSIRNMASPLYNAGTPIISVTIDILGTPRPYYEAYDIGAFEFKAVKPEFRFSPGGNFKFEGDFKFE